jgi:GH15 family glucan-1,4-alpha-glucosidase
VTDSPAPRIEDHAMVSNCQGAALVTTGGTIDWACLPRFDSPAFFAALLDPNAGHWSVAPVVGARPERRYLPDTMVLSTVWHADDGGEVEVWDLLPLGPHERSHRIGRDAPPAIVRVVRGVRGWVRLRTELAIRPEYGLVTPLLTPRDGGAVSRGGAEAFSISSPVALHCDRGVASAEVVVGEGDRVAFGLLLSDPWRDAPDPWGQEELIALADDTVEAWRSWSSLHQSYDGPYADLVMHSGRVLQALTYAPTGAIVAAPTTSLPETPGGSRNWDYRFAWVRDASLTLEALWVAACPDEAEDFFRFFATAAGTQLADGDPLPIMYGIRGERHLPEVELAHLAGYEASRPVRIGNGAWRQVQLDVYGELLSAACQLAEQMRQHDATTAAFLTGLADAAARRWTEPDQGIWEVRGAPQHFTYSKLMCWVALDRAIRLAHQIGVDDRLDAWTASRDEIRAAILERAWSDRTRAFAQAFDSDALDASALMMAIVGFLPANDPKMRATIDAVADQLTDERGFVYRYLTNDGLQGEEGTFAICTFWLAHCRALLGDTQRARDLFERLAACANDIGLLAEEIAPHSPRLLGNFPQAFTHIGLVNAAWAIHQAEQRTGTHTV